MSRRLPQDHAVLRQLPEFLAHANRCTQLRLERMGMVDRPIAELGWAKKAALIAEGLLRRQEDFLREAALQSREAQELSEDRYRLGVASFLEVLEAQRRALQSRSALLQTQRQALDNRVDLYLALGGGFEADEVEPRAATSMLDEG